MFEDQNFKRTFSSAPQSITSLIAAFLEPSVTVVTFILACLYFDEPLSRTALAVCLLVFALTFRAATGFVTASSPRRWTSPPRGCRW